MHVHSRQPTSSRQVGSCRTHTAGRVIYGRRSWAARALLAASMRAPGVSITCRRPPLLAWTCRSVVVTAACPRTSCTRKAALDVATSHLHSRWDAMDLYGSYPYWRRQAGPVMPLAVPGSFVATAFLAAWVVVTYFKMRPTSTAPAIQCVYPYTSRHPHERHCRSRRAEARRLEFVRGRSVRVLTTQEVECISRSRTIERWRAKHPGRWGP